MASYKLLLLRYEVSATGNCAALDNPRILHPIKDTTTINHQPSTINQGNDIGVADMSVIRRYDLQARLEPQQRDHDYNDAPNFNYLSGYKEAAIGCIVGLVVRMVKRTVSCEICINALEEKDLTEAHHNSLSKT